MIALRRLCLAALVLALPAAAAPPQPRPFDTGSLDELRQRHAGRPFVLAFWSTTCSACREELPHWSAWRRRFPEVPVVLVATDGPEDLAAVGAVLAEYPTEGIELRAFASDFAEPIRDAVDRRWYGEVPRSYLYDAAHRREARSGRLDPAELEAWLRAQSAQR